MLNQVLLDGNNFELVTFGVDTNSILVSDNKGDVLIASDSGTTLLDESGERGEVIIGSKLLAIGKAGEMLSYQSQKVWLL